MVKPHSLQQSGLFPVDSDAPAFLANRPSAHLLAYGFFVVGTILAWCKLAEPFAIGDASRILAIAWFPALLVEVFRRFPVPNPAVAGAILSGIAGYDGVLRLFRSVYYGGC